MIFNGFQRFLGMPKAMVIGIDVWHDPARNNPSVVGIVCSMNKNYTQWESYSCSNTSRNELVEGKL